MTSVTTTQLKNGLHPNVLCACVCIFIELPLA